MCDVLDHSFMPQLPPNSLKKAWYLSSAGFHVARPPQDDALRSR